MSPTLLVVEDNALIAGQLERTLLEAGYAVHVAPDGFSALHRLSVATPDLIVLDLMLPDVDGEQILQSVREVSSVPIVVLSAHASFLDRNHLLQAGASDYLSKPYREEDLLTSVARHLDPERREVLVFGPLEFDLRARRVCCSGSDLLLIGTEFELLLVLARHPGRILSSDELAGRVHLRATRGVNRLIAVQMNNIKEVLAKAAPHVHLRAVRDMGYALLPPRQSAAQAARRFGQEGQSASGASHNVRG